MYYNYFKLTNTSLREKNMNEFIQKIQNQGVPVDSAVHAAQYVGKTGLGVLSITEYQRRINELTGVLVDYDNVSKYRMTYAYLIGEALSIDTTIMEGKYLLSIAEHKADRIISKNGWMFVGDEVTPKLDEEGNTKPKKGSKKILAKQVYEESIKGKGLSRKEAIQILVDAGVSTEKGSSTYYANLKREDLNEQH